MIWVSPCFGFPFSFFISVFGISGYLSRITSDFMIVVISVGLHLPLARKDHSSLCASLLI